MKQTPFERIMSQMATVKQFPIDLQPINPDPIGKGLPLDVFLEGNIPMENRPITRIPSLTPMMPHDDVEPSPPALLEPRRGIWASISRAVLAVFKKGHRKDPS